jgi:hypothetical protein
MMKLPAPLAAMLAVAVGMPCSAQDVNALAQRPSLRFDLGSRTQLLVQPPQRLAGGAYGLALEPSRVSETGVGLELKLRPASNSRDLKQLLRLQLSQRSALQFRPRSGGLAITYREQF